MLRRNLIPIIILFLILVFVLQPNTVSEGVFRGLSIWIKHIVPFLFPMSILSNILLQYNFMYSLLERFSYFSKLIFKSKFALIPFFISFISGYPSGALVTNIMAGNNKISGNEANYLIRFTNNCSFQFIAGAIAFSMLGNYNLYMYIVIPHFLGAIILSLLLKNNGNTASLYVKSRSKYIPFNKIFSNSISKSVISILSIGGVIVFFSIFSQFIIQIFKSFDIFEFLGRDIRDILYSITIGILEITNGCSIISASALPLEVKLVIINFLISFSGLSITFQTIAVTPELDLKIGSYIISKFIYSVISALICVLMLIII